MCVCVCVCVCVEMGAGRGQGSSLLRACRGGGTGGGGPKVEEGVWDRVRRAAWAPPLALGGGAGGRAQAPGTEEPSITTPRTCLGICPQLRGLVRLL